MSQISTRGEQEPGYRSLLNNPLPFKRIAERPQWVLNDLAPTRWEARHPACFARALKTWWEIRQAGYTMLGCRRGRHLFELAADLDRRKVPGVIVDCGVWNGGSTALMAAGSPGRSAWAFDSFEGLPEPGVIDTDADGGWTGDCHGAEENLADAMRRWAPASELHVVKGWFSETFPTADVSTVAMLHADGDWYDSVRLTLEHFYPKVAPGGIVAVDDYRVWLGAKKATDEFRASNNITAPLRQRESGVWWVKA